VSEIRCILIRETENARLFRIADREVWIPKSVTFRITKLMPMEDGTRECIIEVEEWFAEKNNL
jgi:hypothetical protein